MLRVATAFVVMFAAGPVTAGTLLLGAPQPPVPALLGASCGGIHVSTYATGFDANGNVTGAAHAWTRCPLGTGRYRRTRHYESWHSLVWSLSGSVLAVGPSPPAPPDPTFTATDAAGNTIATRREEHGGDVRYSAVLTTP